MQTAKDKAKQIADAHIHTRIRKLSFDEPSADPIADVISGKVVEPVLERIEDKECSISCVTIAKDLGHASDMYVFGIRKGFYKLLNK